ncbi:MAG TPA: CbtB-domain containing protein [Dongiaceae bacterium]|nr:CbtB-domain containing protein [Dongiaceae bacterium]
MQSRYGLSPETASHPDAIKRADAVLGAALAAMLGVLMIGLVGFSHVEVFHNTAHDMRHSNGFPCH